MAQYRTITRARAACLASGKCSVDDPVLKNIPLLHYPSLFNSLNKKHMSFWLIKPPEHTWGLPSVGDGQTSLWSNAQFEQVRNEQMYLILVCFLLITSETFTAMRYLNCESAWIEQRNFNQLAVDTLALAEHPLAKYAILRKNRQDPN
jgi:hypothetical protein